MDTTSASTDHHPHEVEPRPGGAGAESVLTVEGLRCRYGTHEAVRGVDLDVRRGEVFALLGTNGAGKTTTLETLEGHRRPAAGTVRVLGEDPHRGRRRLAGRLGVMFQEPSTPDELTPAETLRLWARLSPPGDRVTEGVDALLERVDLRHRRDVRVAALSGGERRRLDLAVALASGPELLLLDEPTTGLDPESRARTWQTIRDVVSAGATVLVTTHYLEEAEALADRLAILHEGVVALRGRLDDVLSRQPARIRCVLPARADVPELPAFRGTADLASDPGGYRLALATTDLQNDLTALVLWADRNGITLRRLQASEPSLAEVFHRVATPMTNGGSDE